MLTPRASAVAAFALPLFAGCGSGERIAPWCKHPISAAEDDGWQTSYPGERAFPVEYPFTGIGRTQLPDQQLEEWRCDGWILTFSDNVRGPAGGCSDHALIFSEDELVYAEWCRTPGDLAPWWACEEETWGRIPRAFKETPCCLWVDYYAAFEEHTPQYSPNDWCPDSPHAPPMD